jgi:hypothetical protein
MTHPAFVERAREVDHDRRKTQAAELYDRLEPNWHAEALCRSDKIGGEGTNYPGAVNEQAFPEEKYLADPDRYPWTYELRRFAQLCLVCPVRLPCLSAAIASESADLVLGSVGFYVSHEPGCDDMTCEGCIEEDDRIRYEEFEAKPMPAGVYGGIPGSVRAHYNGDETECRAWFIREAARQGWLDEEGTVAL